MFPHTIGLRMLLLLCAAIALSKCRRQGDSRVGTTPPGNSKVSAKTEIPNEKGTRPLESDRFKLADEKVSILRSEWLRPRSAMASGGDLLGKQISDQEAALVALARSGRLDAISALFEVFDHHNG